MTLVTSGKVQDSPEEAESTMVMIYRAVQLWIFPICSGLSL